MVKLGKKGITLIELIISIALISIVILFLFSLLIDVKHHDNDIDFAKENQQKRALIIKTVQDDFLDYGLIGLNDTGSNSTNLVINFSFKDGKNGKLTVTNNTVTYKKANNQTEKWTLDKSNRKYKLRAEYSKTGFEYEGDFFSIWFRIPLIAKSDKENVIDDLEFFYIGKKIEVNVNNFKDGFSLGS